MQLVHGYVPTDDQEVGMVLRVQAATGTPVAFCNSSEIQVGGPIQGGAIAELIHGDTKLSRIGLAGEDSDETVRELLPPARQTPYQAL